MTGFKKGDPVVITGNTDKFGIYHRHPVGTTGVIEELRDRPTCKITLADGSSAVIYEQDLAIARPDAWHWARVIKANRIDRHGAELAITHLVRNDSTGTFVDQWGCAWSAGDLTNVTIVVDEHGEVRP